MANKNLRHGSPTWFIILLVGLAAVAILSPITHTTTELSPDRSGTILSIAGCVALVGGIATSAAIISLKTELRLSPVAAAIVLGPLTAILFFLTTASVAETVFSRADFWGNALVHLHAFLPIERAMISSGKGWHYHVRLADPWVELDVTKKDYLAAFGPRDNVRTSGWCLSATVDKSGRAVRIVHAHRWPFAAGRPVRCPLPPADRPHAA